MQPIPALKDNHAGVLITLCTLVYSGLCLALATSSNAYAAVTLPQFGYYLLAAHIIWGMALYISREGRHLSTPLILLSAIIIRLCLVSGFPVLEDDIYRYLWDGFLTSRLGSAYGLPPAMFFPGTDLPQTMQPILGLVSYPDIATVYGPLSELLFAAAHVIAPGQIWPIKAIILCFDIACLVLLAQWLSPRKLLLISWCPLLLFQFALNAHIDIIAIALLMAGVHFILRKSRWWLAPLCLALAVSVKIFALLAAPFLLLRWRQAVVFVAVLATLYLPVLLSGHSEFDGLSAISQQWNFNSLYALIANSLLDSRMTQWLSLTLLGTGVMVIYYYYGRSTVISRRLYGCFISYTLLLLLLPALNPWYLAWLLLFAAFTDHTWPWVFAVVIWLSLLTGINLQQDSLGLYEMPGATILLEFAIVATAPLWAISWKIFRDWRKARYSQTH